MNSVIPNKERKHGDIMLLSSEFETVLCYFFLVFSLWFSRFCPILRTCLPTDWAGDLLPL